MILNIIGCKKLHNIVNINEMLNFSIIDSYVHSIVRFASG